ncbi:hypothetical protein JCM19241_1227 [Vibrio ishigakensis]|uniref:Uncharacterized protein n=1 Tax=Vibrio ishigakensis TaxID=1481914 RepID=A0A0B8QK35_9VIBR|nr:hypothetical protein JCM19241_1227 [Vibrio ishigakensis]
MSYEGDEEYRYQNIEKERVIEAIYVQRDVSGLDIQNYILEFNKNVDSLAVVI